MGWTLIPIIFRKFPKMSEDYRRLPYISKQSSKMFRSYRNKFRFVRQLNLVNLIVNMTSLISSHVRISNLSSHAGEDIKFIFTCEDIMF